MSKENLKFWNSVSKTDPKYTKSVSSRGGYTAISPMYQAMQATEQWGLYGKNWGLKNIEHDYSLVETTRLCVLKAIFFYPDGEFEITNAIEVISAKGYPDSDFAKKLETNTISKALSKLGFSADVFMGEFDDHKYVQARTQEANIERADDKEEAERKAKQAYLDEMEELVQQMQESVSISMLSGLRNSALRKANLRNHQKMVLRVEQVAQEVKQKLESKKVA